MNIQLSDHFTYSKLLRFTLPSIAMMIFSSIYCVVDGYFVSNFAGKTSFAAVNMIYPFIMMLGSIGFMFGTGGCALIAKTLGEGQKEKANKYFSLVVFTSFIVGVTLSDIGIIFLRPIAEILGAEGALLENCIVYGRILLMTNPAFILQMEFQSFFVTAEKPQLGLTVTIIAGVTNMVLDALFVAVLGLGLKGAAAATGISQICGGIIPLIYFILPNKSLLRITKTNFQIKPLVKMCTNGASELMSQISLSIVSMLYNIQLLKYSGEDGVAAYGVLMYVCFVFLAIFIGYIVGSAPVISFNFGAKNTFELKGLLKKSLTILGVCSVCMLIFSEFMSTPLSKLFVGYDESLFVLTERAFRLYSFSFLFSGFAMFFSGFFTALNDGLTSAIISFLRTLVFQVAFVLILPLILGVDGIWISVAIAEACSVIVGVIFTAAKRKKYNYW